MPLVGVFKTLHVMLFILGLTFASSVRQLQKIAEDQNLANGLAGPHFEVQHLSKRWRAERNMWLTAFAFTLWTVLAAFYKELGKRLSAEERLIEIEMSMDGYTADTTREVSSKPRDLLSPRSVQQSPSKPTPPHQARTPPAPNELSASASATAKESSGKLTAGNIKEEEPTSDRFAKKDQ